MADPRDKEPLETDTALIAEIERAAERRSIMSGSGRDREYPSGFRSRRITRVRQSIAD